MADIISKDCVVTSVMLKTHLPDILPGLTMTVSQYLARLAAEATTVLNAADYARSIFDLARRRSVIETCEQAISQAYEAEAAVPADEIAAGALEALDQIAKPARRSLQWLDMSNWDAEPLPERPWAIFNRVPLYQVGLFSGEGGTGKSIIELHKDVAHVAGKDWLGSLPERDPAFYVGAEDDKVEIHIRLAAIAKHCGVTFEQLTRDGLRVLPLLGQDATLCFVHGKSGKVEATGLYKQLYEAAGDIKPKNISIDTLSRAFAGNEIDRVQVYQFAMHMQALAMVAGGAVTILSHPSPSGINSGSGISGSTAWHGAFRFRQYLKGVKTADGEQPGNDLRELQFKKNQYGPMAETILLRYRHGLFLPEGLPSNHQQAAVEARVDEAFLACLEAVSAQGRIASDRPGSNFAPKLFAGTPEAKGATNAALELAMARLFGAGRIKVEHVGPPSRQKARIVRVS
jgi:RecA-family ATPase